MGESSLFFLLLIPCFARPLRPSSHVSSRHSQQRDQEAEQLRVSLSPSSVLVRVDKHGVSPMERCRDESPHNIIGGRESY